MSPRHKLVYPEIEPVQGSESRYVVTDPFAVATDGGTLAIQAGFQFDGGSVPRLAWPIVGHPFSGKCLVAYLAHDALYAAQLTTREQADDILLDLLDRHNVAWLRRHTIYRAVRMFGGWAWDRPAQSVASARRFVSLLK